MKSEGRRKFSVLFTLYIAQSIPMSFFSTVVPVIMRQEHYSLESIGLLQLVKLPWILKFLFAPFVDNRTPDLKSLKRWIIVSELFYAAIIFAVGFLNLQVDFKWIVIGIVLAFIASAFQDIGTDIFAIRILQTKERSYGNSMQSAGSFAGSLIGTGVLLLAYYYLGWSILLALLALFVTLAVVPLMFYQNRTVLEERPKASEKARLKDIPSFFKGKSQLKHLLLLIFHYSGIIGMMTMLKPYMVDLGYNIKEIGFMSGIVGTSVATSMAFLAGYIINKIGRAGAFRLFAFVHILVGLFFFYLSQHSPSITEIYIATASLWGAYGLSTVIIYTTAMDKVRVHKEGTDFTIQIVITHLSSLVLALLSGKIAHHFGYSGLFLVEIALSVFALFILILNYPIKIQKDEDR